MTKKRERPTEGRGNGEAEAGRRQERLAGDLCRWLGVDREELDRRTAGLSRPRTKAGRLQRECLALLCEHRRDGAIPTSNRFLFYELEGRGIVPKVYLGKDGSARPRRPDQDVTDALIRLRELGLVPWDWIVDESRSLVSWGYSGSVAGYIRDTLAYARIDLWAGVPPPLILCESRSLAGVLRDTAARYLCPIAATNGQTGGFLHTSVGPLIAEQAKPGHGGAGGVVSPVLYFGDLDLSGGHIEENTRRVLEAFGPLDWTRLAITDAQVREHGLSVIGKPDRRYKPPRTFPAVETEALSQREIVRVLVGRLDALVPEPLEDVLEREGRERVLVRKILDDAELVERS